MFGVTQDEFNQANKAHAINHVAVCLALIKKGLLTEDEIETARVQATSLVDQEFARKSEALESEFDKEHPGVRDMMNKMFGVE